MNENVFGFSRSLPEPFREIFMWLCQDVASLRIKWGFYLGIYSDEKITSLLSELARSSFHIIEESLRHDMTMLICRLSDPAQSFGKDNLSLPALVQRLDDPSHIEVLLDDFLEACNPIRQYEISASVIMI